ncbi:cerberus [Platysternon megacephalum]|uniref:Cerberus n=1 Tax=Platysternon megacephalum TaxID=55544 RepID=A0A4D9EXZ5_9SAUR|nr:cerberus [Platysternon megacephalum]
MMWNQAGSTAQEEGKEGLQSALQERLPPAIMDYSTRRKTNLLFTCQSGLNSVPRIPQDDTLSKIRGSEHWGNPPC